MRTRQGLILSLLVAVMATAYGQGSTLRVRDTVQIPSLKPTYPMELTDLCFDEIWSVYPSRPALYKEVVGYKALESRKEVEDWPGDQYQGMITYEYELRDPQTGKENVPFGPLGELVQKHSALARNYDIGTQLISVRFREDWFYDTLSREFIKKVQVITPVIWQLRQTKEGEPVNDGDSGLPVYYKLELEPIRLRNQ